MTRGKRKLDFYRVHSVTSDIIDFIAKKMKASNIDITVDQENEIAEFLTALLEPIVIEASSDLQPLLSMPTPVPLSDNVIEFRPIP